MSSGPGTGPFKQSKLPILPSALRSALPRAPVHGVRGLAGPEPEILLGESDDVKLLSRQFSVDRVVKPGFPLGTETMGS